MHADTGELDEITVVFKSSNAISQGSVQTLQNTNVTPSIDNALFLQALLKKES